MSKTYQITPLLHVRDLREALEFFCNTLGFELKFRERNYAYVEFEGHGLRMLEEPERNLTPDGKARVTVYIDVSDVDAVFARLAPALSALPTDCVEPLMDKPWSQREFQVRMPDGDWLNVGAPIRGSSE